jgi:hypothetical protein
MAAGSWLFDTFNLGGVADRVQAVYTPVDAPRDAANRKRAIVAGTPEIYLTKVIDNSRLVKANDPQRAREMRMFASSVACLFLLIMVYALQHLSAIEYGYKIESQKKMREELIESNRALRLEEASLRDPERIDVLARRMGLESPQAGQVQRLEVTVDSSSPMMARASNVAVVVAQ